METVNNLKAEDTLQEMCKILEKMPEERRAYLNGYVAGMNAEQKLAAQRTASA